VHVKVKIVFQVGEAHECRPERIAHVHGRFVSVRQHAESSELATCELVLRTHDDDGCVEPNATTGFEGANGRKQDGFFFFHVLGELCGEAAKERSHLAHVRVPIAVDAGDFVEHWAESPELGAGEGVMALDEVPHQRRERRIAPALLRRVRSFAGKRRQHGLNVESAFPTSIGERLPPAAAKVDTELREHTTR